MKKGHLIILITVLLILLRSLTGCRAKTVYIPVHSATTVTELKHDTIVEIQLAPFRDSVVVSDTISRLENRYAHSEAIWLSGRLSHSLKIKDMQIPVKIQYLETIRTDSIQVAYPVEVEKVVYRLKWWQETLMWAGVVLLIVTGVKLAFNYVKRQGLFR